jgi:Glycosyltransferase 61
MISIKKSKSLIYNVQLQSYKLAILYRKMKHLFNGKKKEINIPGLNEISVSGISLHTDVVSYPVSVTKGEYDFSGGLIDSKTSKLIDEAILIRYDKRSQEMPPWKANKQELQQLPVIEEVVFFGGILFDNFGHFLLESLARLWAYDQIRKFNCIVLFYTPWGIPDIKNKGHFIHQSLKAFDIPLNKIIFLKDITRLKKIIVSEQKYGFGKCRKPDQIFISFIKTFKLPGSYEKGNNLPGKIYVSRSQLPYKQGRPVGENLFEKYLVANGYYVIYPEKLTLYKQLALYKHATKIIFCDGGATYCNVLLPDFKADVAIVARRRDHRWNYKEITDHFLGYKKNILWIDEVTGQYEFGLETWDALAEIDWHKVSQVLKSEGFTSSIFEGYNDADFAIVRKEALRQFIQSIQNDPKFLNFMEKLKEQHELLPTSFDNINS